MQWVTMSAKSCIKCKIYFSNVFHWLQWVALSAGSELHLFGRSCIKFNKLHRVQDLLWEWVAMNAMSLSQCIELQLVHKLHWVSFNCEWFALTAISCNKCYKLQWVHWLGMICIECKSCWIALGLSCIKRNVQSQEVAWNVMSA